MQVFYERDADPALIKAKRVAVIGYGAQGHAHALNLRDAGVDVAVALHAAARRMAQARADGFAPITVADAARTCDVLAMCAPDEAMPDLYAAEIAPHLRAGQTLMFVHGFAYHYGFIAPPAEVNVAMVAPKGPGKALRDAYVKGGGLPCIVAVAQDNGGAEALAYSYAAAIGCGRAGMIASTFKIETEGDLYGEQVVLCGGLTHLIRTAWEVQVEAGTPPELAYFDCLHEVKLLSDLIHERGIAGMHLAISNTAEWGEYVTGPRIIDERVKEAMRAAMADVQSGKFAREWMAEHRSGGLNLAKKREEAAAHPIEEAGRTVRALLRRQSH
ncbi:MAG TPA: ketol-acid reductoisomerase [Vitreimonas sp.]|uniref:ketol-acid reductoisomerase n=1 Tax=Vitreimonas sp. TaxID=3069702 RepID=UPI002D490230|nr:ketol-acid reductoisomerase [Vitreimonas sp.]HYD89348.1 ketol-acid reductoisomerase [Vitreimonas sp.]